MLKYIVCGAAGLTVVGLGAGAAAAPAAEGGRGKSLADGKAATGAGMAAATGPASKSAGTGAGSKAGTGTGTGTGTAAGTKTAWGTGAGTASGTAPAAGTAPGTGTGGGAKAGTLAAPLLLDDPDESEPAGTSEPQLAERVKELEAEVAKTKDLAEGRQSRVNFGGYIDVGFFVPQGNGTGIIRDDAHAMFPEYAGRFGWVFLGDLLAPAVNTRGEAADLGDLAGVERFDSIRSRGAPGFVANEINLALSTALGNSALASVSVDFIPRSGAGEFAIGDIVQLDLAQVEWMPTRSQRTSIFVGKIDSVLGIEYRDRKSARRFGITPSLIARYTVGTALGAKVRSKFGPDDLVVVAAAVTNGSNMVDQFHFFEEIDSNAGKTMSGRLALRPPLPLEVEVGVSGSYGAQDRVRSNRAAMWFWGVDLQAQTTRFALKAQYLKGGAPGSPEDNAYGLALHAGGYVEGNFMVTPIFGLIGRAELRDAFVWLGDPNAVGGADRAYLTKSWRGTVGVRLALSERVIVKGEYLRNGEYGRVPGIDNDVLTTSLVLID
jgi:hypothetical protein